VREKGEREGGGGEGGREGGQRGKGGQGMSGERNLVLLPIGLLDLFDGEIPLLLIDQQELICERHRQRPRGRERWKIRRREEEGKYRWCVSNKHSQLQANKK
jgi:hypothetical protein